MTTPPLPSTLYVGLDAAKLTLQADLAGCALALANTAAGHRTLLVHPRRLQTKTVRPAHVVCEGTGGYERAVVRALQAEAVPVSVHNAARVRAFARARGRRAKTDALDAAVLSAFGAAMQPESDTPPSESEVALAALVARRDQLRELVALEVGARNTTSIHSSRSRPRSCKNNSSRIAGVTDHLANRSMEWNERYQPFEGGLACTANAIEFDVMRHFTRFFAPLVVIFLVGDVCSLPTQEWARTKLEQSERHREYVPVKYEGRTVNTLVIYPEARDKASVVVLISRYICMYSRVSGWFSTTKIRNGLEGLAEIGAVIEQVSDSLGANEPFVAQHAPAKFVQVERLKFGVGLLPRAPRRSPGPRVRKNTSTAMRLNLLYFMDSGSPSL